jgi:iron complex transport system ATP-binding protein
VWLTGSLNGSGWDQVRPVGLSMLVLFPAVLFLARPSRALQMGDDTAKGLAVRVERCRVALIIVGANACGNSTLLRALARLLKPKSGSVLLDGESIHRLPTKEVATRFGILPQSPIAPEGITVADLVGGQRQRVWIAMALAQGTDLMLLDEPTTFLDLAHQVEVLDLHVDLKQREQRTVVLLLHDLNHAARYSHHLIAMSNIAEDCRE